MRKARPAELLPDGTASTLKPAFVGRVVLFKKDALPVKGDESIKHNFRTSPKSFIFISDAQFGLQVIVVLENFNPPRGCVALNTAYSIDSTSGAVALLSITLTFGFVVR